MKDWKQSKLKKAAPTRKRTQKKPYAKKSNEDNKQKKCCKKCKDNGCPQGAYQSHNASDCKAKHDDDRRGGCEKNRG